MDPTFTVRADHPVPSELEAVLAEADFPEVQFPVARPASEPVPDEDAYDSQILAGLVAP